MMIGGYSFTSASFDTFIGLKPVSKIRGCNQDHTQIVFPFVLFWSNTPTNSNVIKKMAHFFLTNNRKMEI